MKRVLILLMLANLFVFAARSSAVEKFDSGQPIWPQGLENEKNLMIGFRAVFEAPQAEKIILRAATSSIYRFFLNG